MRFVVLSFGFVALLLVSCGDDTSTTISSTNQALSISHSCLIQEEKVACWGDNSHGQLGIGKKTKLLAFPVFVRDADGNDLTGVKSVALGENHTCAVVSKDNEESVLCWGNNSKGQLGVAKDGDTGIADSHSPKKVSFDLAKQGDETADRTIASISSLSSGSNHNCASLEMTTTAGTVKETQCWGDNSKGQLGVAKDGDTGIADSHSPQKVSFDLAKQGDETADRTIASISSLSSGASHNCASLEMTTTPEGTVKETQCWGDNSKGQLGVAKDGDTGIADSHSPQKVSFDLAKQGDETADRTIASISSLSSGASHNCASLEMTTTPEGTVKETQCWGDNSKGQLGVSKDGVADSHELKKVSFDLAKQGDETADRTIASISSLSSGSNHNCASLEMTTTPEGTVKETQCWGDNSKGQLGVSKDGVADSHELKKVSFDLAKQGDETADRTIASISSLSSGSNHNCASLEMTTTPEGTVEETQCWGDNSEGQLGADSLEDDSSSPLAIDLYFLN